ncbi:hypothetical protein T492DRAFT_850378 [Pavlovales sp. CCMP2436]|nr:hypothetical protein T492DRAFT_850378 [Pavlovales sp. CCMP2436]
MPRATWAVSALLLLCHSAGSTMQPLGPRQLAYRLPNSVPVPPAPIRSYTGKAKRVTGGPRRVWREDGSDVKEELLSFIDMFGTPGEMPSNLLMQTHGRTDLVNVIFRRSGGLRKLAHKLGLSMGGRHVERNWSDPEVLKVLAASRNA